MGVISWPLSPAYHQLLFQTISVHLDSGILSGRGNLVSVPSRMKIL